MPSQDLNPSVSDSTGSAPTRLPPPWRLQQDTFPLRAASACATAADSLFQEGRRGSGLGPSVKCPPSPITQTPTEPLRGMLLGRAIRHLAPPNQTVGASWEESGLPRCWGWPERLPALRGRGTSWAPAKPPLGHWQCVLMMIVTGHLPEMQGSQASCHPQHRDLTSDLCSVPFWVFDAGFYTYQ